MASKMGGSPKDGLLALLERKVVWNLAAVMFTIALVLTMVEALSRVIIHHSYFWAEELSRYLILWAFFLTLGLAGRENAHIRMSFIVDMVPKRIRIWFSGFAALGGAVFTPILAYGFYRQIERLYSSGIRTESDLDMPMWAVVSVLVVGTALFFVYYIHCLVLCIKGSDPFPEDQFEEELAKEGAGS